MRVAVRQRRHRTLAVALSALAVYVGATACTEAPMPQQPAAQPTGSITMRPPADHGLLLGAGDNAAGQLARSRPDALREPTPIKTQGGGALHGIVAAAGGDRHTLALRADGT